MKIFLIIFFLQIIFSKTVYADFHSVGWLNTFVPGGGRLLMGEYGTALQEATLEISTFAIGDNMSPESSYDLDGTPIDYPAVSSLSFFKKRTIATCKKYNPAHTKCLQTGTKTVVSQTTITDYRPKDASKPLTAAVLQEFGLKYHLMNTFFSYRDQFNKEGQTDAGQGIDQRSSYEMFKDPFRGEVLSSAWVYVPLALSAVAVYLDYASQLKDVSQQLSPLNKSSKVYLGFDQMVMYPVASAAPEEAFFRGFVQNEFYYLVRSPYFSVPMSSLVFALSHSQDGWPGAFVSGLYQGFLTYRNDGNLSYANAVHFWGVVFVGLEAYMLTLKSEAHAPPVNLQLNFSFQ
jgi:hypothetical protein